MACFGRYKLALNETSNRRKEEDVVRMSSEKLCDLRLLRRNEAYPNTLLSFCHRGDTTLTLAIDERIDCGEHRHADVASNETNESVEMNGNDKKKNLTSMNL
ncbi:hypothetical protein DICVIV_12030 [Dictyocaulus viviparus]|uniref:Uncharacterized protein n=1 Tax=Dictyocaulus viviparus TaxID=29172 RepID=A0A0D8XDZ1_DICVI|nr:hypothetical protein DICVIV_12030 [Dictyocaulus viviparus]